MNVGVNITVVRGSIEKTYYTKVDVDDNVSDLPKAAVRSAWEEVHECARVGQPIYFTRPDGRYVVGVMPADILSISYETI